MAARVLAIVAVVGTSILPEDRGAHRLGGVALLGIAFYFLRQQKDGVGRSHLNLTNPFELTTVLKFGLILTAITAGTKLLTRIGSGQGVYVLALFSGIADVDAMTLSMSRQASDPASITLAANAILICCSEHDCQSRHRVGDGRCRVRQTYDGRRRHCDRCRRHRRVVVSRISADSGLTGRDDDAPVEMPRSRVRAPQRNEQAKKACNS